MTELEDLTAILADWSEGTSCVIYLFGSRVRGDHRPDSDVDVLVEWPQSTLEDLAWWALQNDEDFASVNGRLPGRLKILTPDSCLVGVIRTAAEEPVHRDRNVVCVWMPPKP